MEPKFSLVLFVYFSVSVGKSVINLQIKSTHKMMYVWSSLPRVEVSFSCQCTGLSGKMMEEELDTLCDQLNLSKLEQEEIQVELSPLKEVITKGTNCLITKLHTNKPQNHEAFKNTMQKVWRPTKTIWFHEVGLDMMIMEFENKLDKERVLQESPWNFD